VGGLCFIPGVWPDQPKARFAANTLVQRDSSAVDKLAGIARAFGAMLKQAVVPGNPSSISCSRWWRLFKHPDGSQLLAFIIKFMMLVDGCPQTCFMLRAMVAPNFVTCAGTQYYITSAVADEERREIVMASLIFEHELILQRIGDIRGTNG
jgi:hypothetical protein